MSVGRNREALAGICPADCVRCDLGAARTRVVYPSPVVGDESRPHILALGEAPGANEDAQGEGFVGRAGKTLDRLLAEHGISRAQYARANVCWCRPPGNRKPGKVEIEACLPHLAEFIRMSRPVVILAVGATPSGVLCGKGGLQGIIGMIRDTAYRPPPGLAHPMLRLVLHEVRPRIVCMPHTSPLAMNRNAPDGCKWAEIAREQIAAAAAFSRKESSDG